MNEASSLTARDVTALARRLGRALANHKSAALAVALFTVLDVAYGASSALSFSWLVDGAIVPKDLGKLWLVVGALTAGVLTVSAVGVAQEYLLARTAARVAAETRRRTFTRLCLLPLGGRKGVPEGEVMASFGPDISALEMAVAGALPALLRATLSFAVGLALLYALDVRLALVSTMVLPLSLVYPRVTASKAARAASERRAAEARALDAVAEVLGTHETVKAFSLERPFLERYVQKTEEVFAKSVRATFIGVMVPRSSAIAINLLELLLLALLATYAFRGNISIGTVLAFHALFVQTSIALVGVTQVVPALVNVKVALARIDAITHAEPAAREAPGARALPRLARRIEVDDVHHEYVPGTPALAGASLSVAAGEMVAVVGRNGSGKSTLAKLFLRLLDPDEGVVRFDGTPIDTVTLDSLRGQIGYVMQSTVLFEGSVRANVAIGAASAADDAIEAACRAAGLSPAELSHGYDTSVGALGEALSGGQRQRVALARALLREPALLVLDEATSAMDPETEKQVLTTLANGARERTIIVITHRLGSIADFRRIVVMHEGRVVEDGRHAELIALGGVYARLWESQGRSVQGAPASMRPPAIAS